MAKSRKNSKSQPPAHPFDVVERARAAGISRVVVGVSCGKDATATLALATKYFAEVRPYFMYIVPGLSFQEQYLGYLERTFGVTIERLPHWMLSGLYRGNSFRHPSRQTAALTRRLTIRDIEQHLRSKHGIDWFMTGEKAQDSVERNAQIRRCGGINHERRRVYPVAFWTHSQVFSYLKQLKLALPPDYRAGYTHSFGSLWYRELAPIRQHFPDDWERVRRHFPLVEAQMLRYERRASMEAAAKATQTAATESTPAS